MIRNNINQYAVKGIVKIAPATNHLIQSITHKQTGDLIVYTNKIYLSKSKSNGFVVFVRNHMIGDGKKVRRMIIITPSASGCNKLKEVIEEQGFDNISVYLTKISTTNYVVEKKNVLYGVENFIEHSNYNCPSFTITDDNCRRAFIIYTRELLLESTPVIKHAFDRELIYY